MALKKPTPEDQRKLHAEINQINHQQFLLTTTAITLFGLIVAWMLPRTPDQSVGSFEFSAATLLSLLILALFLHGQFLRGKLRTYTIYLTVTECSNWEQDFGRYLKEGGNRQWIGFSELYVYMTIVILSMAAPFLLAGINSTTITSTWLCPIDLVTGFGVLFVIYWMGRKGLGRPDDKIAQMWEKLNKEAPAPNQNATGGD